MRKPIFFASWVLATVLFLVPSPPEPPGQGPWDKIAHAAIFAALAILALRAWPGAAPSRVFLVLLVYGAAIEAIQFAIPWRSGEVLDLAADAVGALAVFVPPRRGNQ